MNGFRGGFGGGNINQLMAQAQKMQQEMLQKEQEVNDSIVESSVSGGLVKMKMNGKKEVKELKIDPKVVDSEDVEMLEDLIVACFNDASEKVDNLKKDKMGGLNLPMM